MEEQALWDCAAIKGEIQLEKLKEMKKRIKCRRHNRYAKLSL